MAFITKEDLGTVMYGYQIDQITEGDDNIVNLAIEAAIDEVKSYLTGNNRTEWLDGRIVYDADAIFSAKKENRNALILGYTKTIAKWWIVELCNADIIYEQAKDRYDRAIKHLSKLAKGEVTLKGLPTIKQQGNTDKTVKQPFRFGSRQKFNHE